MFFRIYTGCQTLSILTDNFTYIFYKICTASVTDIEMLLCNTIVLMCFRLSVITF